MLEYLENPVFICGHRKSGTTMLISLFDNVENAIVYPDDSGIFYLYFPRFASDKYSNEEKILKLTNYIIKEHFVQIVSKPIQSEQDLAKSKEKCDLFYKAVKNFSEKNFDFKKILKYFIKCFAETFYADRTNPKVWIEKTTSTEIYANELSEMFPKAKFIHIIRDPRDNWASLKSGWDKRYKNFNDNLNRLMQSMIERGKLGMEMAEYNKEIIGKDRYVVVRYEDITLNPEREMSNLANFIGIPFSNSLLRPTTLGFPWKGNNFTGKNFTKPSNDNVGKWIDRIDQNEAKLIEYHFKDLMNYYGYNQNFTLRDQLRAASEHYKWFNFSTHYSAK